MNVVAIIQARMSSTRLPGKVLADLAGQPMLVRVVSRVCRAKRLTAAVIATTTQPIDDAIVRLCEERNWSVFRGSVDDVLDRYHEAALAFQADIIVRITADCPLIDPEIIDKIVDEFFACYPDADYVSNGLQRTFPRGLDVEVMSLGALREAWREDRNPKWREHVTPYVWHHPDRFHIRSVVNDADYSYMRWTVDTIEDLTFVRKIYDHFQHDAFSWKEVLRLLKRHPDWLDINRHVRQKVVP